MAIHIEVCLTFFSSSDSSLKKFNGGDAGQVFMAMLVFAFFYYKNIFTE